MVFQIVVFCLFLAIAGYTLYHLGERYLDYQVSWHEGTNREILRLTRNRRITYRGINIAVNFLQNCRKNGPWE